ncbi:MAG: sulfatase-like hydrolase/transferase, partial [Chloroflexi bacterium]|nr:sulfatase-like hydrolase/transferase [Chloroflexota bacterium]
MLVNEVEVGQILPTSEWTAQAFELDPELLRTGVNGIEFAFQLSSKQLQEHRLAEGSLAIQFRTIALVERSQPIPTNTESAWPGRDRQDLGVNQSGKLFIPLDATAPMRSLTFAASARPGFGRATDLELSLASDDDLRPLSDDRLDGLWGRTAYADTLLLDGLSGPACLVVEVDFDPGGEPFAVETVELEPVPSEPEPPSEPALTPPDIVLIVLDAARPDHFGCYGYGRDTTPQLDRLASESLVFSNAFATAAYTACSMPTMISGLSFIDHGVTNRRRVLTESVTTLAESLQQEGYRTSCYSANPNHSARRGLGQGCDTFEELWKGRSRDVSEDPYVMSALASERLAEDSSAPQFLMLHYIPPHEPYTPRPEFDLFGDDRYDGEVDGTPR